MVGLAKGGEKMKECDICEKPLKSTEEEMGICKKCSKEAKYEIIQIDIRCDGTLTDDNTKEFENKLRTFLNKNGLKEIHICWEN